MNRIKAACPKNRQYPITFVRAQKKRARASISECPKTLFVLWPQVPQFMQADGRILDAGGIIFTDAAAWQ